MSLTSGNELTFTANRTCYCVSVAALLLLVKIATVVPECGQQSQSLSHVVSYPNETEVCAYAFILSRKGIIRT